MAQAVSRQPLTAEARVGPCEICGGQSGAGARFSPNCSVFPVNIVCGMKNKPVVDHSSET
jgi:hypothetical protein